MPANLENSAVATGLKKVSFHSNPKERQCQRMFKLSHNCSHLTCWQSNAQNSPSHTWTVNFQMFKLVLEKLEEPEIKLLTSIGSLKKRIPEHLLQLRCAKAIDCVWKILQGMETPEHLTCAFWEICTQVRKQQLEPDMEQWTGSKLGKEYVKAVYCHPA